MLVPSHDLEDPGHRISRHKLDLATRWVSFESLKLDLKQLCIVRQ